MRLRLFKRKPVFDDCFFQSDGVPHSCVPELYAPKMLEKFHNRLILNALCPVAVRKPTLCEEVKYWFKNLFTKGDSQ